MSADSVRTQGLADCVASLATPIVNQVAIRLNGTGLIRPFRLHEEQLTSSLAAASVAATFDRHMEVESEYMESAFDAIWRILPLSRRFGLQIEYILGQELFPNYIHLSMGSRRTRFPQRLKEICHFHHLVLQKKIAKPQRETSEFAYASTVSKRPACWLTPDAWDLEIADK